MKDPRKSNAIDLCEFKEENADYINDKWELVLARSEAKTGIIPGGIPDSIKIPQQPGIWPVGKFARRIVACWNFCAGVSTEMIEANTLLGEFEKGRKLAGELGKKLGEIPETSERYFIGTETGIEDLDGEAPIEDKSEHISELLEKAIAGLKPLANIK